MTAADIADAVEIECHGRGYDLEGSPQFGLYSMWVEAVGYWGADSPAALGCLEHGILPEAWGTRRAAACVILHTHDLDLDTDRLVPAVIVKVYAWADTWREAYCGEMTRDLGEALVRALEAAP